MKESRNSKKQNTNKKVLATLSLMLIIVILFCFLYSLIQLIIEPSNIFVVEER